MEIITRKQCIAMGLKKYFTGKPCKHGHIAERWDDGHCVVCHAKHSAQSFQTTKDARKEIRLEFLSNWKANNPERAKAHKRNDSVTRRRLIGGQKISKKYSKEILNIYEKCPKGYHVDHQIPIKGKSVCGLHVPWNLQYLTSEANIKKGNSYES